MKRFLSHRVMLLVAALLGLATAGYAADPPAIPDQVEHTHWSCQTLEQLGTQYHSPIKFPAAVVGRRELATSLMTILGKVADHCEQGGGVSDDDRQQLESLHAALQGELEHISGYPERRDAILRILAKPDDTQFSFKLGMGGYLRGEGAGEFKIAEAVPAPGHGEGRFVYRVKPYFYWHPEDYLHLHIEGQGYGYRGSSQEFNKGSLYQGFVEMHIPGNDLTTLRGGRQEFTYGSAFILGSDSFNDGLTFDGGLLRLKPANPVTIDLFAGSYARPFSDNMNGGVGGVYASLDLGEGSSLDAYWLKDTGIPDRRGSEYLAHAGLRGTWQQGSLSLEVEPVLAHGRVQTTTGLERIEAYGGHADVNLGFDLGGHASKVQLGYAFGSGSQASANGSSTAKEFRNPNHDAAMVGDLGLFGDLSGVTVTDSAGIEHHASGLHAFSLGWGIDLVKTVNFAVTGRYFRADEVELGASKQLGIETDFALTWVTCDYFSLIVGYDRFFPDTYIKDMAATNRPIDYGYLMVTFDVSKAWPRKRAK